MLTLLLRQEFMVDEVGTLAFFVILARANLSASFALAISVLEAPVANFEVASLRMLFLFSAVQLRMLIVHVVNWEAFSGAAHRICDMANLTVRAICVLEAKGVLEHVRVDVVTVIRFVVGGVIGLRVPVRNVTLEHSLVSIFTFIHQAVIILSRCIPGGMLLSVDPLNSFLKVPVEGPPRTPAPMHRLLVSQCDPG